MKEDEHIQNFLEWIHKQSINIEIQERKTIIRAFYFCFSLRSELDLGYPQLIISFVFAGDIIWESKEGITKYMLDNFDKDFVSLEDGISLELIYSLKNIKNYNDDNISQYYGMMLLNLAPEIQHLLGELKEKLPSLDYETQTFKQWWEADGREWYKQLRTVIMEYKNMCYDWQFSDRQKELLQQYYNANKLLLDCLNNDCYVSREVRHEIEDSLLLPIKNL